MKEACWPQDSENGWDKGKTDNQKEFTMWSEGEFGVGGSWGKEREAPPQSGILAENKSIRLSKQKSNW